MILGLMLLAVAARSEDVLQPEHATHEVVIERTANAYRVGDFVNVLDADGREFTVQIKRIAGADVEFETAAGDAVQLPVERIIEKAGLWARSLAWLTDTTAGNWTLAGGGGLLALGAGKVVTDAQLSSDKDTDQVGKAEAAALAESAAAVAIVQGPDTKEKFWLSGEVSAGQDIVAGAGVSWRPSIVFGYQPNITFGSIASYTLPPAAAGQAAQVVSGHGSWKLSGAGEIYIEGTSGVYDGHARIGGTVPGATGPFTLRTRGGVVLSGGTATSVLQE